MTDSVKDALNVDQDGKDIAVPATPNSTISQDNGEGLGEDLKCISDAMNSSGRASEEERRPSKASYSIW